MIDSQRILIGRSIRISLVLVVIGFMLLVLPNLSAFNGATATRPKESRGTGVERPAPESVGNAAASDGLPIWLSPFGLPPAGPTVTATKSHTGGPFHLGDTINYSVTISDSGVDATGVEFTDTPDPNTTFVPGSVMVSPVAIDDGPYVCTGNLSIAVPAGSGVLANDYLGLNPAATITAFDATSANGGTVSLTTSGVNAGAFTYQPAAGFDGTDTFTYTLSNTTGSSVGTVTITVSNMVWFINNAAGSAGDGRFASPFNTLAAFQAINDGATNHGKSGQAIFIYQGSGNYTGPLTLLSSQRLTGQGDALTSTTLGFTPAALTNVTLPGATAKPTLTGTLTLATGVTALAIDLNTGSSTGITGLGGLSGVTVGDASPTATNGFTVTTTTGTAVTLNNVGGTFTFRSINANGTGGSNTTGVSLVSMTGSFTVTGDGSTANSGGTIQHETGSNQSTVGTGSQGIGFYMNNAQNVSLSFMHLHDFDNFGLQGITVSNLTLAHCTFDGSNGNATSITPIVTGDPNQGEGSVYLYNLTGTCSFTNSTFSGGFFDTMEIVERTGTLAGLTIDTCSFSETNTSSGGDELDVFGPGSTNANMAVTLTNSTFTQAHGNTFSYISNGSGTMSATVTGNTFRNNDTTHTGHGVFLTYAGSDTTGTAFTFDVENNTFGGTATNGFKFTALAVGKAVPTSPAVVNASGKIINNTFGTNSVQGSSTSVGSNSDALELDCDGQGTMTTLIKNNQIHGFDEYGMSVFVEEGSCTFNGTITGNTIDTPNTNNAVAGIDFTVGAAPSDTVLACLHVGELTGGTAADKNSISGAPGTVSIGQSNDILFNGQATASSTVHLPGYSGTSTNTAAVATYLGAANTLSDTPSPNVTFNQSFNNFVGGADCATPPLMFAPGGVEPEASVKSGSSILGPGRRLNANAGALTQRQLDFIVRAARERWKEAGLSPDEMAILNSMKFRVGDLSEGYIGVTGLEGIILDRSGAGHGWFVDRSPMDDQEFNRRVSRTLLYTSPAGKPAGHLDLLTAVSHEMGHRLGLPDSYGTDRRGDLMYESLSVGERRLPSKSEAENANFAADAQAGPGAEKQYILRAVQGENTNEETRRYAEKLDPAVLNYLAQAAIQRWQDAGVSQNGIDRLQAVQLEIADLPGDELSVTGLNSVQIDENAAGYGWFADQTPQYDSNFTLPIRGQEFQADLDSPAFGHMDLLTVLMNAYGRILNKKEKHAPNVMQAWLMKSWLSTGTRRVPAVAAADQNNQQSGPVTEGGVSGKSPQGRVRRNQKGRFTPQAAPVDVVIGTLPAGKSVIVKFQVTVNNPLTSPSTATTVSNTGSVAGTNFTTVNTNTDTAQLCVPPVTTTALTNQQVAQGTTATFTTTLTGATPFTFVWKKNGTTLVSGVSLGGRATITTNTVGSSTTSTLAISGAQLSDSDTYTADGTDLAACGDAAVHQSATLTVVAPPTITKSFNPTTIPLNGTSTITLTITNPNAGVTLTGVNFSDNFTPGSGLQVANPAGIGSTCSGTWNATPGDTFLNFGGGTLAPGSSCSLTVNVTSTKSGTINNATNAPQSNEGGFGVASNTATLTVIGPPTISKAFVLNRSIAASPTGATESGSTVTITTTVPHGFLVGQAVVINGVGVAGYNGTFTIATVPTATTFTYTDGNSGLAASGGGTASVGENTMPLGGTVTLMFTLNNLNASSLSGIAFTDTLPAGLQVAATPNASDSCGGTFTPNAGDTSLSFSGGLLSSGGTCLVTVDVTATTAGVKNNTTGAVTSTEGGTGGTASASITVLSPPSIAKAFGAPTINPGGTTTLTFTITNPNPSNQLLGVGFTDALPAGLQVAASPGASTSCGGTFAPNPGDTTLTFSGGTIAAAGTCTVSVNVTATTAGLKNNTTGNVASANAGTGNTASATITVASPPSISKAFSPTSIAVGGTSTLTFTITNPNASLALTGVAFADVLPSGLQVAATPNASASCGGTFAPNAGDTTLTFSGGTIAAAGSCTVKVDVTGVTGGVKNNTSGNVTSTEGGTGNTASATLTVVGPPSISKAFLLVAQIAASPTGATESGSTVTITTTAAHNFLAGQSVTISGVGVAGYNGTFTIASVPTATTFTYTDGNTGLAASGGGTATVMQSTMPLNATAKLMFTIMNTNPTTTLSGVGFTDALPSGLQVAATPNASDSCGGTFAPNPGDTSLTFSSGLISTGGTCLVTVDVTGTTAGVKNNTTGNVTSNEGGAGNTANASITVVAPPSISKAFGSPNIPLNGTTTLTFTITNPNTTQQLTGVAFTDALPSGLQVAATPGASTSCGGTFSPNAGDTTLTFSGGTIAASGTCTISVNVTGTTVGVKNNTTSAVTSNEGGTGAASNTATLSVASAPTISKAFGASSIIVGQTTSLQFTITNPNASLGLTGVSFTDTLPAGITVANGTATTCGGGTLTTTVPGTITLTGATLAASGNCSFSVTVTGATAGVWNNTTGAVSSNESGAGTTSNTATLTVIGPPSISKSFDASTIPLNGTSVLTFTITNPNTTTALTGVAFTDTLPSGLTVPTGTSSTCGGGTLTTTAPNTIALTGGSVAPSSNCVITVTVTGSTAGVKNNTTGAVSSTEGGTGTTSNTATITVLGPPAISKAFGAASIPINGTTTLTFTLNNPNATVALTGVAFSDSLPSGLQVAATPGASTSCGGTFAPNAGDTTLSFSGGTIAAGGSCTVSVNVTGTTAGVKNNTTGAISSTNGGTGTTSNTATLTVGAAPTISKAFGAATIPLGTTTSLSFTITNPNATLGLTGIAFTDTLPAGLTVANGSASTCGGGTLTTTGPGTITLSGGSIAAAGSCTFNVTVTGVAAGVWNNTTGAVMSNEGGTGTTSNTATLTVLAPATISKAFSGPTVPLSGTTTVTFTINNPNATVALTGVGFSDALPAGLKVASTPNSTSSCGGSITAAAGSGSITFSGGTIAAAGSCTVTVDLTGVAAGVNNNTTGNVTSTNGGTGGTSNTATITVVAPATITKAFGAATVPVGQTTTLTFTLTNPNPTVALTGVAFTDPLPSGLVVANPANASDGCGGTFAPNPGDTSLSFSGGTIAPSSSCVITVSVQVTSAGAKTNITSGVTSTEGGTGAPSNPATVSSFDKCLKDDHNGNFVQFNSTSGDYMFTICGTNGFTLSGKGTIRFGNSIIYITDSKTDRRVTIQYNTATLTGSASLTKILASGSYRMYSINDTNPHPVCQCGS